MLSGLLVRARSSNASDLHLDVGNIPWVRIDGKIRSMGVSDKLTKNMLIDMKNQLFEDNSHLDEIFMRDKQLTFTYTLPIDNSRYRVNVAFERGCITIAIRLLNEEVLDLDALFLPSSLRDFCDEKNGLVLITGINGSGKSTTLAALVNYINNVYVKNIMTLEKPIEILFKNKKCSIKQREIPSDCVSFELGVQASVRQDVDIVVVGEMLDRSTIKASLNAAQLGKLVIGTLHTNNISATLNRIISIFPSDDKHQIMTDLAFSLRGIISQELVPKIGGGRVPVNEILKVTPSVTNLLLKEKYYELYSEMHKRSDIGMLTRERSLKRLLRLGVITLEQAEQYADHSEYLLEY